MMIKIRHKLEAAAANKDKPATAGGKRKTTETVEDKDKDKAQWPLSGCLEIKNVKNVLRSRSDPLRVEAVRLRWHDAVFGLSIADGKYAVSAAKAMVIQHTVPASKIVIAQTADKYDHQAAKDQPISMSNYMPKRQSNTYVLWDTGIHLYILIAMVTYYDPTKPQYDAILAVEPENIKLSKKRQGKSSLRMRLLPSETLRHQQPRVASRADSLRVLRVVQHGQWQAPSFPLLPPWCFVEAISPLHVKWFAWDLEPLKVKAAISVHEDPDGRFIDLTLKPETGYHLPEMVEQEITGRYLGAPNCDAAESSLFMRKQPGVRNQLARLFKDPGPRHPAKGMRFPRGKDPTEPPP
ncbi:hypothetical protein PG987_005302 [Apiospora arundinis]